MFLVYWVNGTSEGPDVSKDTQLESSELHVALFLDKSISSF